MNALHSLSFTIPPAHDGDRLDAALCVGFPDSGMRARRRLWEHHTITVNGKIRPAGFRVSTGDLVKLAPLQPKQNTATYSEEQDLLTEVRILCKEKDFAAVFKPSGLHSAGIASSPSPCVEQLLPKLFKNSGQSSDAALPQRPALLVNRLDKATSGILVIAFGSEAAEAFKSNERTGRTEKLYLAVVEGSLSTPLLCPWELDTDNRTVTSVLPFEAQDSLRHTSVLPLGSVSFAAGPHTGKTATLVLASIHRGARHQIRAHLAHAGYPIVGDSVYGTADATHNTAPPPADVPSPLQI